MSLESGASASTPPTTGPLPRAALLLAVVVMTVSFAALLIILALYFAQTTPHPVFYWLALWGIPVGFALMCIYMLMRLGGRRRLYAQQP